MRLAPPLAFLAAVLAWIMVSGLSLGQQGKVVGTVHDLGVTAYPSGVSGCETCHLPHDASGERLWADGAHAEDGPFSGIRPLCYSCHDGTVAAGGAYVFDPGVQEHPVTPGEIGEDCDMCHDPHVPDYGGFLLFPTGANHCKACHAGGSEEDHPLNVGSFTQEYEPQDSHWSPNEGDFSGTRLWDYSGWQSGGYVKCLTCHGAHGTVIDTALLTMGTEDAPGATSLCPNCHR